jgi:fructoselysine-6-P-deglycase FrlB-like protein
MVNAACGSTLHLHDAIEHYCSVGSIVSADVRLGVGLIWRYQYLRAGRLHLVVFASRKGQ